MAIAERQPAAPRELLQSLGADTSRLLVAGAASAPDDEGLRRRAAALSALARKVPAVAPIAAAVERVRGAEPGRAAVPLLDLLVLVRRAQAVMATGGPGGPLDAVERAGPWQTALPADVASALYEGLTLRGRWPECERTTRGGLAPDLRLLDALFAGLGQRSESLVAFVMQHGLPAFGRAAVAEARRRWDPQGKATDVRLLELLCRLDRAAGAEACSRAARAGSPLVRQRALALLPGVAPAKTAIPVLVEALGEGSEKVRTSAQEALAQVGSAAVRALIAALTDENARTRAGAAAALGRIGAAAGRAVPALLQALRDERGSVRAAAAQALGHIGPAARGAIPLLCEMGAGDRDSEAVRRAIGALEELGADPAVALPVTRAALRDVRKDRSLVASAAMRALRALGPDAHEAVPDLCGLLGDERTWVRTNAALALGRIGPAAAPAVSLLIGEARRPEGLNRRLAAQALGEIGPAARPAAAALARALRDKDPTVRFAAALALIEVMGRDGHRPPARAALVRALAEAIQERNYARTLGAAVEALRRLDPSGETAVEALLGALRRRETNDRPTVLAYLLRLGAPRERLLDLVTRDRQWDLELIPSLSRLGPDDRLVARLTDSIRLTREEHAGSADPTWACWLRRVAARALGDLGPAAAEAVPALTDLGRSANLARFDAAVALARITGDLGPVKREVRPALRGDALARDREWAAAALGYLGDRGGFLVPALKQLLGDAESGVRRAAADSLGRIGPPARLAATTLVARLDAGPKWLRGPILQALLKIGAEPRRVLGALPESFWDEDGGALSYAQAQHARHVREELRQGPAVAAALRTALADEDEPTRLRAALTLACLDADLDAAIPVLAEAASVDPHDGHIGLRLRAAELLTSFGARAAGALPRLTAAAEAVRHWELRSALRRTIEAVRRAVTEEENHVA